MENFYFLNLPLKYLVLSKGYINNNPKYIISTYESIKKQGLNKPLVVRDYRINKYEILLGGSRYLALIKLKKKTAPCILITTKKLNNKYKIKSYQELLKITKTKKFIYKNEGQHGLLRHN